MLINTPKFEDFNNDNPFKDEALHLEEYADSLTTIVKNSSNNLVASINGDWGTGKTTFIKLWQHKLKTEEIPHIYIDAFENDYIDDPFMTVISTIYEFHNKNKSEEAAASETSGQIIAGTKSLCKNLVKLGSKKIRPVAEKLINKVIEANTGNLVNLTDIKDLVSSIASEIDDSYSDKITRDQLTLFTQQKEVVANLQDALSAIPSEISNNPKENPLVIIVDELDRCRPSFSMEFLERIKHIFSIKNIIFVLAINKKQLCESIKCVYGNKIQAIEYLQKIY